MRVFETSQLRAIFTGSTEIEPKGGRGIQIITVSRAMSKGTDKGGFTVGYRDQLRGRQSRHKDRTSV